MTIICSRFKYAVATLLWTVWFSLPSVAQTDGLEQLFEQLKNPELENWQEVEDQIWIHWSRSGSASADLLLERGRDALESGDVDVALEHFTALTDHAPEFAEGYNARATAYYQAEEFGLSVRDIEATLALNPMHFGALAGLGLIFESLGEYDDALAAYRAVAAIHPHRPNVKGAIKRLEGRLGGSSL